MKWRSAVLRVGLIALGFNWGCARMEKVKAMEGDLLIPYDSIGTLEVRSRAPYMSSATSFWTSLEILTLGFAKTPSRGEQLKEVLRAKLAQTAGRRYDADAVIKVQYWPDPELRSFPDGFVHARGEMIRYRPFPSKSGPP